MRTCGSGSATSGRSGSLPRCGSAWPRRGCSSADAVSTSTRSSSATPATSTSRRHGGSRAGGRSSSTRSSRCTRPSSRIAAASRPARPRRVSCARSTGSRSGAPTSSSPTPPRTHGISPSWPSFPPNGWRSASSAPRSASSDPAGSPPQEFHALFVGKLIPLHGVETILAAARLAPGDPVPHRRQRSARRAAGRAPAQRRVGRVGRVRAAAGGAPARRVRPRGLRHLGEDGPGDPEQGVPGARLRDAARDRGHPGGARAARRRRERAAGPRRRPRGAGGGGAAAGGRCRARAPDRRRRRSPPTGHTRARRCSASGGGTWSSSSSLDDAVPVRLARDGRLRRRLQRAGRPAASGLRQRPLRSREHDAGGLVDRERRRALGHRRPRRADLAAGLALRPDPRAAGAALVALAEP